MGAFPWERDFVEATGDGATLNAAVQRAYDQMQESDLYRSEGSFMSPSGAAGVQDGCEDSSWYEERVRDELLAPLIELWPTAEGYGWSYEGFDRVLDLAVAAVDAGCCPKRVNSGVELVLGPPEAMDAKLSEYGTDGRDCGCKDVQHQRPRRCKHQVAYIIRHQLQKAGLWPTPMPVPMPWEIQQPVAVMPWEVAA